jgi:hypothetical protein
LSISLDNDGVAPSTVDLSGIADHDWYEVGTTNAPDAITDNIFTEGNVGIGVPSPTGTLEATSSANVNAFVFTQGDNLTGERDVFTIEDQDTGGGGQDESSVLKVLKSGPINTGDNGFSLIELASTGGDPGNNKYWISGRTTDEGAVEWGVDITDNDFWSEGGITLGATGADGGAYSGGAFRVNSNGDTGVGTITPDARLDVEGGTVRFSDYGGDAVTGTLDNLLGIEADGDVIEVDPASLGSDDQFDDEVDLRVNIDVDDAGKIPSEVVLETNVQEVIQAIAPITSKAARIFYPPSIAIDASTTGNNRTVDLYQEYIDQYGSPVASSDTDAPTIPTYGRTELYYYVTYADPTVFDTTPAEFTISAGGVLTYDIIATPSDYNSLINVVFVVK